MAVTKIPLAEPGPTDDTPPSSRGRTNDERKSAKNPGTDSNATPGSASISDDKLTPKEQKLADKITPLYMMAGSSLTMLGMVRQDQGIANTGQAVGTYAAEAAKQWVVLARSNDAVRKWLERIAEGVGIGGLVAVHAFMVLPLLVDRGLVPDAAMLFVNTTDAE